MRTARILLVVVVAVFGAACAAGGGAAIGSMPLRRVVDVVLPGDTSRMDYASLDPARHRLFIAHLGASQVLVVDTASRRVIATLDHVDDVHGVLAVPSLNRVFATATGSDTVITFDATTLRELARARTASTPDGLAYDPDTRSVFISNEGGPSVTEIDAGTGGRRRDIAIGGEAGNTAYDPNSHHVFVDVQDHNVLAEIDPGTGTVVRRQQLPGCRHDHGLEIDPAQHRAFVACDGNARLVELDLRSLRRSAIFQTGGDPDVLAFDSRSGRLYVLAESGNRHRPRHAQ